MKLLAINNKDCIINTFTKYPKSRLHTQNSHLRSTMCKNKTSHKDTVELSHVQFQKKTIQKKKKPNPFSWIAKLCISYRHKARTLPFQIKPTEEFWEQKLIRWTCYQKNLYMITRRVKLPNFHVFTKEKQINQAVTVLHKHSIG